MQINKKDIEILEMVFRVLDDKGIAGDPCSSMELNEIRELRIKLGLRSNYYEEPDELDIDKWLEARRNE